MPPRRSRRRSTGSKVSPIARGARDLGETAAPQAAQQPRSREWGHPFFFFGDQRGSPPGGGSPPCRSVAVGVVAGVVDAVVDGVSAGAVAWGCV